MFNAWPSDAARSKALPCERSPGSLLNDPKKLLALGTGRQRCGRQTNELELVKAAKLHAPVGLVHDHKLGAHRVLKTGWQREVDGEVLMG